MKKFLQKLLVITLFYYSPKILGQSVEEFSLKCPMADIGLVATYKINFKNNSVVSAMEGFVGSKTYFFEFKDNKIFIPPSEFGEEVIDLSSYEVKTRAGYAGASWKAYSCSKFN